MAKIHESLKFFHYIIEESANFLSYNYKAADIMEWIKDRDKAEHYHEKMDALIIDADFSMHDAARKFLYEEIDGEALDTFIKYLIDKRWFKSSVNKAYAQAYAEGY